MSVGPSPERASHRLSSSFVNERHCHRRSRLVVRKLGPDSYIGISRCCCKGNFSRIQVVLADKDDRQISDGGQIEALMKCPIVDRTIAKEGHANVVFFNSLKE